MVLETDRLTLREYVTEDFDALFEIVSDIETMQHYPAPFDEDKTRSWIQWNLDNYKKCGFVSFGRTYEVRRVRRAVVEQFIIKRIMTNCSMYIYAPRKMTAHLKRRINAQYITTK